MVIDPVTEKHKNLRLIAECHRINVCWPRKRPLPKYNAGQLLRFLFKFRKDLYQCVICLLSGPDLLSCLVHKSWLQREKTTCHVKGPNGGNDEPQQKRENNDG